MSPRFLSSVVFATFISSQRHVCISLHHMLYFNFNVNSTACICDNILDHVAILSQQTEDCVGLALGGAFLEESAHVQLLPPIYQLDLLPWLHHLHQSPATTQYMHCCLLHVTHLPVTISPSCRIWPFC